jgi:hypothetical protein
MVRGPLANQKARQSVQHREHEHDPKRQQEPPWGEIKQRIEHRIDERPSHHQENDESN